MLFGLVQNNVKRWSSISHVEIGRTSRTNIRLPTFIGVRMILDMCTLTWTLIFSQGFFKVFKIFLVLIILYCLKTYCYIFDVWFICLSLGETDSRLYGTKVGLFIKLIYSGWVSMTPHPNPHIGRGTNPMLI